MPDVTRCDRTAARVSADRWPAGGAPGLGGSCNFRRAGDGFARYGDREHRASGHRGRSACRSGRRHLGGERLSDRPGGDAAAARGARRDRRSPPGLSRRASAFHAGLARLRAGAWSLPSLPGRTRAAGPRRQRHHEREYRAGPLRLSRAPCRAAVSATTRWWSRPPSRSAPPLPPAILAVGAMALAVRRQHSLWPGCDGDRAENFAAHSARDPFVRFSRRDVGRGLPRPVHAGGRKCCASRAPRLHRDRTWSPPY